MKIAVFIGVICVVIVALIFGVGAYVNNLENELPPAVEGERKGRARYLESRFPSFFFDMFKKDQ